MTSLEFKEEQELEEEREREEIQEYRNEILEQIGENWNSENGVSTPISQDIDNFLKNN